jgi:hypothetical protein
MSETQCRNSLKGTAAFAAGVTAALAATGRGDGLATSLPGGQKMSHSPDASRGVHSVFSTKRTPFTALPWCLRWQVYQGGELIRSKHLRRTVAGLVPLFPRDFTPTR